MFEACHSFLGAPFNDLQPQSERSHDMKHSKHHSQLMFDAAVAMQADSQGCSVIIDAWHKVHKGVGTLMLVR